jgi:DNA-binding NarL/FixJ family response regulator
LPAGGAPRIEAWRREIIDVLGLAAAGATNRQIAAALRVSNETVKSHVKKLLTTLRSTSRAYAVTVGFCRGILKPKPSEA